MNFQTIIFQNPQYGKKLQKKNYAKLEQKLQEYRKMVTFPKIRPIKMKTEKL